MNTLVENQLEETKDFPILQEFRKHSAFVHSSNAITLSQKKVSNVLMANAALSSMGSDDSNTF